jgi:CHAD domain-containing protein
MPKSADRLPLCNHLDTLVETLGARIPRALEEFDEESIHQARVTTRRLKAALDLLESTLDKDHARPFARLGRKLRRRLGPLRDLDVMIGHLNEIKPSGPHGAGVDWLRATLLRDRVQAREKSSGKAPATELLSRLGSWLALRQDVIGAEPQIDKLLVGSLQLQLNEFSQHADALGAKPAPGAEVIEAQPGQGIPQGPRERLDPHQLRIAGKNLRYTLELAHVQGHDLPKSILGTFKRLQKFLGLWHDFVVLAERAMQASLDEQLALHDPATQRGVLKLADLMMTRSQKQLDGFARLWAAQGPPLVQTIRQRFPAVQPASGPPSAPETGPGPAATAPPPIPAGGSSTASPAA